MAIEDFGKKIGGAKKDLWKERGLSIDDLLEFNSAERLKFIKKDNVWKKPDYEQLVADGLPIRVAYFVKMIRDSLPTKPVLSYSDKSEELINYKQDGYISFISKMRDAAMELKTEDDVKNFYQNEITPYITQRSYSYYVDVSPEAYGCITNKLLKCAQVAAKSFRDIDRDIKKKQFCYSEDEKLLAPYQFLLYQEEHVKFTQDYRQNHMMEISYGFGTSYYYPEEKWMVPKEWENNTFFVLKGREIYGRNFESKDAAKQFVLNSIKEKLNEKDTDIPEIPKGKQRKRSFVPKQLAEIDRTGPDVRGNVSVTGQDYLSVFGFRGGEFGNWLNEKDRQASLDFGYEALLDLSRALDIRPDDLSLDGRLSIAFGARGRAGALAHYEPLREVINLTKMKGAGSLAHEWAHALDNYLGRTLQAGEWITEHPRFKNAPNSLSSLISSLRYKEVYDDAAKKSQELDVKRYENRLRRDINQFFTSGLSDEEIIQKEQLINALIDSVKDSKDKAGIYIFRGHGYPEIDAISEFRKQHLGRVIPKDWRIQFAHDVNALLSSMENVGKFKTVRTDFYENSIMFDQMHSKTDHGYWQSTIEMFARAFACYVNDKLKEMGEQSDYLCGHSELSISMSHDKEGNPKVIKAIPDGDERKIINHNFDLLFKELKELELLHSMEKMPEISSLENFKENKTSLNGKKVSLDTKITNAKEKSSSLPVTDKEQTQAEFYKENYKEKNGQLEFIF